MSGLLPFSWMSHRARRLRKTAEGSKPGWARPELRAQSPVLQLGTRARETGARSARGRPRPLWVGDQAAHCESISPLLLPGPIKGGADAKEPTLVCRPPPRACRGAEAGMGRPACAGGGARVLSVPRAPCPPCSRGPASPVHPSPMHRRASRGACGAITGSSVPRSTQGGNSFNCWVYLETLGVPKDPPQKTHPMAPKQLGKGSPDAQDS